MAKVANTSRYGMILAQNAKRRSIIQAGMDRSNSMRNFMTININGQTNLQLQTTEMQLRSKAQAAAKARVAALDKLA